MTTKTLIVACIVGFTLGTLVGIGTAGAQEEVVNLPPVVITAPAPKKMVCGPFVQMNNGSQVRYCEFK